MFINSFLVSSALVLATALQVSAHSVILNPIGVTGAPVRNDALRPSAATPCGSAALSGIDTGAATAAVNGLVSTTITNFNAGKDGSRQVTAKVDATGLGKTFVAATVTLNGDLAPTNVGSQPLKIQLPAGTVCTGGATKDKCLLSLTTAGGFGNCIAVTNGAAAAGGAAAAATPAAAAAAGTAPAAAAGAAVGAAAGATAATAATGKKGKGTKAAKGAKAAAAKAAAAAKTPKRSVAGTRAPRNARSLVDNVASNVHAARSWVWAA